MWWLCPCSNAVVVMCLYKWCCGYVLVAIVLWLCTCSNGVVSYVLVAMVVWLCTSGNDVVAIYL